MKSVFQVFLVFSQLNVEGTLSLNILLHLLFYKYCVEKFQVQDSDLEYFVSEIWRFEKHIAFSETKPPLEDQTEQLNNNSNFVATNVWKNSLRNYKITSFHEIIKECGHLTFTFIHSSDLIYIQLQGFSQHGCQGCLAPIEFLDSDVWHPLILATLLNT